jgi:hypothetical protein
MIYTPHATGLNYSLITALKTEAEYTFQAAAIFVLECNIQNISLNIADYRTFQVLDASNASIFPPPKVLVSHVNPNKRLLKTCGVWVPSNGIPLIPSFLKIDQT